MAPDGLTLASRAMDGTIRLWALADGTALGDLRDDGASIRTLAFAADAAILASAGESASGGGRIKLWRLNTATRCPELYASLFDPAANAEDVEAVSYNVYDTITGRLVTYTLPCGSPIPPGAHLYVQLRAGDVLAPCAAATLERRRGWRGDVLLLQPDLYLCAYRLRPR